VEGNPSAQEQARTAQGYSVAGFVLQLAGAGALGTGVGLAMADDPDLREAGTWVALGGMTALIAGAIINANAARHESHAIAIYNDGVDGSPASLPSTRSDEPCVATQAPDGKAPVPAAR
jgi:hypothetical protein